MSKINFTDEAHFAWGKGYTLINVVVFGGSKQAHKQGNLWKNHKLSKDFKRKETAEKYLSYLIKRYNLFVEKNPQKDLEKINSLPEYGA